MKSEKIIEIHGKNRERNFRVTLDKSGDETCLMVTHDGYRWNAIILNHREMETVRELLARELENYVKEKVGRG